MSKIGNIYEGWKNALNPNPPPELVRQSLDRLEICLDCIHYRRGWCKKCGCILKAKTMARAEKCPVGKW